ncbi:MAG: hypothetical protein ACTSR8_06970 [Promethearchaeota archaeon]
MNVPIIWQSDSKEFNSFRFILWAIFLIYTYIELFIPYEVNFLIILIITLFFIILYFLFTIFLYFLEKQPTKYILTTDVLKIHELSLFRPNEINIEVNSIVKMVFTKTRLSQNYWNVQSFSFKADLCKLSGLLHLKNEKEKESLMSIIKTNFPSILILPEM